MKSILLFFLTKLLLVYSLNLDFLDPTKLQTTTASKVQQDAATTIINKYTNGRDIVKVHINTMLFTDKKDIFSLRISNNQLQITASTGVAAVWGFNYYLKKYCKSHIGWQVSRISIPDTLPLVDEVVVANDRFRYYQNVCTASYSFVWWDTSKWLSHVEWMALNGINLALAPIAQEAAWMRVYQQLGMTEDEIDEHFTGPAFLSWLRMGNIRGWGGPLMPSWHARQRDIQDAVLNLMLQLGMVPVLPTFNGHVPKAFKRLYPNTTFYSVETWNKFSSEYCCGLFVDPNDPLFKTVGKMFLKETAVGSTSHIYTADPFNEIIIQPWSTALVQDTSKSIFSTLLEADDRAVWMLQNWMFVHDPVLWPKDRVKSFLTTVPSGRFLILDLQSEQWPQYYLYEMYFGQPFIWCMLHNFGGTLGMFGNMHTINKEVYDTRARVNSTMIGIGLTPEGINQNYVVYELMLESGWRKSSVSDLDVWVAEYAERRYGCNSTASAWRYLLRSVYSFEGLNRVRGKYVITRRPSLKIKPWAWYKSHDLFEAFKKFVLVTDSNCDNDGFYHDLVDVTRQALQYRSEQLYINIKNHRFSSIWVYNSTVNQFLDIMTDMENILATHDDFSASSWLSQARSLGTNNRESYMFEVNARNQITLWGPNGEISDYACKQWAELFHYYYIPRWRMFFVATLEAKINNEFMDEKAIQDVIRSTVEEQFLSVEICSLPKNDVKQTALLLYQKWSTLPGLEDLPLNIIMPDPSKLTTLADTESEEDESDIMPTVTLSFSGTTLA